MDPLISVHIPNHHLTNEQRTTVRTLYQSNDSQSQTVRELSLPINSALTLLKRTNETGTLAPSLRSGCREL